MSTHPTPLRSTRILNLVLLGLLVFVWAGCAYFRWGDPSYSEIQKRTQEEKAADEMKFDPTAVFEKKE